MAQKCRLVVMKSMSVTGVSYGLTDTCFLLVQIPGNVLSVSSSAFKLKGGVA